MAFGLHHMCIYMDGLSVELLIGYFVFHEFSVMKHDSGIQISGVLGIVAKFFLYAFVIRQPVIF